MDIICKEQVLRTALFKAPKLFSHMSTSVYNQNWNSDEGNFPF